MKKIICIIFIGLCLLPVFGAQQKKNEDFKPAAYFSTNLIAPLMGMYSFQLEKEFAPEWGMYISGEYFNLKYGILGPAMKMIYAFVSPDFAEDFERAYDALEFWMAGGALGMVKYFSRRPKNLTFVKAGASYVYGNTSMDLTALEEAYEESLDLPFSSFEIPLWVIGLEASIGKRFIFQKNIALNLFLSGFIAYLAYDITILGEAMNMDFSQYSSLMTMNIQTSVSVGVSLELVL